VTDEELKAIDEKAGVYERDGMQFVHMPDVRALVAEVRRLRGLIKRVEEVDNDFGTMFCPWCGYGKPHAGNCPAFTPDGGVR
jgi:hypothetical protein